MKKAYWAAAAGMFVVAGVGVTEVVVMLDKEVAVEDAVTLPDRFELDSIGVLTVVTLLYWFTAAVVFDDKLPIIVAFSATFPYAVASSATLPTDVMFPESIAPAVVVFSDKFSMFVAFPATVLGGVAFSSTLSIDVTFPTTVGLVVAVFSLAEVVTGFSGKMKRGLDVVFGSRPESSGKFCPGKRRWKYSKNFKWKTNSLCLKMRI